jgi:hypothetical protein
MRRSLSPYTLPLLTALALLVPVAPARSQDAPGLATITRDELMRTDRWLAAPGLRGRLAGSPGFVAAAKGMARQFERAGLKPGGERGYLQPVEVEWNDIHACDLATIGADGRAQALRLGKDYTCRGLTGSGRVEAPVVFVGYGVSWPERGYDDYAGIDVRGKIVLAIKEAPPFQVDSSGWGERTLSRPRAHAAAGHGARALLVVPSPAAAHPQRPIGSMLEGGGAEDTGFPTMQVDVPVAESLLPGADLRALKAAIDSTHAPRSGASGVTARVAVTADYHARQASYNVVGVLPGADPALRDEAVVIGAHLDHVGSQGALIFPGANDNASGASAVLQIARAFAASGVKPKRTVVFALFTSEESGLQGAQWFVEHPPVPREHIVGYINLDCIAVGDSFQVGGGTTSPAMWKLARSCDARGSRLMMEATWPGGGADAAAFWDRGIPIAYFASHDSYTHLHLPSDTPETLNPALYEALVRVAYGTAWELAQGAKAKE